MDHICICNILIMVVQLRVCIIERINMGVKTLILRNSRCLNRLKFLYYVIKIDIINTKLNLRS